MFDAFRVLIGSCTAVAFAGLAFAATATESGVSPTPASPQDVQPPRAAVQDHEVRTQFGATRNDPYFWLRDDTRSDPKVIDYLRAENRYTDSVFAHVAGLETTVRKELAERIPAQDSSVPFKKDGYWYYSRFLSGQEYPVIARKRGTLDAPEEVILDEPKLAPRSGYYAIGSWAVSPNGRLLAWTEDHVGRLQYELHIKDLTTGRVAEDTANGLSANILWGGDNKTVLYVVNNEALRPEWVKAHVLGVIPSSDPLIFDETDETFYSMLVSTNDHRFLCLDGFSLVTSEWRCAPTEDPTHFQVIANRVAGHVYDVDHAAGTWYIRTNLEAPNYRIVSVADKDVSRGSSAWHELAPARTDRLIEGIKAFEGYLAIEDRFEANRRIVLRTPDGHEREVAADEAAFTMTLARDQDAQSRWVRYTYDSLTTPTLTREVNVDSSEERTLKETTVTGYDKSRYVTERAWVKARDGARIPVSLLHRKDWKRDGKGALFQFAYGAYAFSVDAKYLGYAISLADRGVVFAIAHVRGGDEMGRSWYDEGRLFHKMNTFTDFIDVTRGLVAQGYAASDRVAALGGSGGGTLMGAVANLAPEDYRAILAMVPYVDAVTTMLDPTIPLVTREYTEWGNPNVKEEYEYMLTWSPYDNVARHAYPAMYVYSGLWDSQVQYYEPTKWVAKLRADRTDKNPLVLRMNMQGGHGGASGRFQKVDSQAEYVTFALWQLGYRQ
jgi:oligopeptidase B